MLGTFGVYRHQRALATQQVFYVGRCVVGALGRLGHYMLLQGCKGYTGWAGNALAALHGSPNASVKSGAGCVGYGFCHFYILHNCYLGRVCCRRCAPNHKYILAHACVIAIDTMQIKWHYYHCIGGVGVVGGQPNSEAKSAKKFKKQN